MNHATGFTYEPGSTFKAFTVAAALEEDAVDGDTMFTLPPSIRVADRTIEESHPRETVSLSVADILAQSSNVGAVKIGLEVGATEFDRWVRRLGFAEPTGIQFPGEEQGIVPALDEYSGSTLGNMAIRAGTVCDADQMAAAYSAIANGGVLRQPRLVVREAARRSSPGRRVLDEQTAARVREMLEGVLAPGGSRAGGRGPRLYPRRQDRDRGEGRGRRLLGVRLRRLVRRLRPGQRSEAVGGDRRRRARGQLLRRRGRRACVRRHRRVRAAASRRSPGLGREPQLTGTQSSSRLDRLLESPPMRLVELIAALDVESVRGDADVEISDLAYDSTQAAPGALFLCVRGMTTDGHQFAPDAVDRGAVALVVERRLDFRPCPRWWSWTPAPPCRRSRCGSGATPPRSSRW